MSPTHNLSKKFKEKLKTYTSFFKEQVQTILYKGRPKNYTKFFILCNGRTGSNMLISYLNSHKNIKCYNEVFHQYSSILGFPFERLINKNELNLQREKDPMTFLERNIFKPYHPKIKAVGFKLIYWHAQGEKWRELLIDQLKENKEKKIIHLKRQNKLDMFISEKLAWKTNKWVAQNSSGIFKDEKINPRPEEFSRFVNRCKELEEKYEAIFSGTPTLFVNYEDILSNSDQEFKRITDFLDLDKLPLSAQTIKQNRSKKKDVIENYEEMKVHFSGTPLEHYFNE